MNPIDPDAVPPADPNNPLVPKPWQKPPEQQQPASGGSPVSDPGVGDAVEAGVEGTNLASEIISGAADFAGGAIEIAGNVAGGAIEVAGNVAGGVIEAAGSVAGAALEGTGAALEGAGGCADGCGGCSLAILITLFASAGTAMALFR